MNHSLSRVLNEGYEQNKICIAHAYKCFIKDKNGNVYIDTALGAGTHLLGYSPKIVVDAIRQQANKGTLYILPNAHTYELARLLSTVLSGSQSFVFCNTGSEATMRAVRIARAFSGKKKIGIFSGGWHGGHDVVLFDDDHRSNENEPRPIRKSAGIPDGIKDMVVMLPYNHDAAFDLIRKHRDELAVVMIEPAQGSNPRDDVKGFLSKLRKITSACGVLLCFDEIISGFRIGLGGCREYYGIKADLTTYGKALGGGLPIGMIAGKKKIMQVIKGDSLGQPVFMGGTFSANPLVMCVAKKLLSYLIKNKKKVYPYLDGQGKYLRRSINGFCVQRNFSVRVMGIGSMSRLIFTDKPVYSRRDRDKHEKSQKFQNKFYTHMLLKEKVHVNNNRIIYLSTAHSRKDIQHIIDSIKHTLSYFSSELTSRSPEL